MVEFSISLGVGAIIGIMLLGSIIAIIWKVINNLENDKLLEFLEFLEWLNR